MMSTTLVYEYKGYQYRTYLDVEDDNMKTFHYCYRDGKEVKLPYDFYNHSPYSDVPYSKFVSIVDEYSA